MNPSSLNSAALMVLSVLAVIAAALGIWMLTRGDTLPGVLLILMALGDAVIVASMRRAARRGTDVGGQ